jgi:hypothetical protein
MATPWDNEESLTPEEILLRFKKVIGRDMTPEEKHRFFLPETPQGTAERTKPRVSAADNKPL